MTWTPKIMPDDAPELAGSLVGSMLKAEQANSNPTPNDLPIRSSDVSPELIADAMAFMQEYDDDFKALAVMVKAGQPLWQVMYQAYEDEPIPLDGDLDVCNGISYAAEIEALRDWLVPDEPEPVDLVRDQSRTASTAWQRWDERMDLRNRLTEQARIARGEQ